MDIRGTAVIHRCHPEPPNAVRCRRVPPNAVGCHRVPLNAAWCCRVPPNRMWIALHLHMYIGISIGARIGAFLYVHHRSIGIKASPIPLHRHRYVHPCMDRHTHPAHSPGCPIRICIGGFLRIPILPLHRYTPPHRDSSNLAEAKTIFIRSNGNRPHRNRKIVAAPPSAWYGTNTFPVSQILQPHGQVMRIGHGNRERRTGAARTWAR